MSQRDIPFDDLPADARVRRLLRAARHLGGFQSVAALARVIEGSGLSESTLTAMEAGRRFPRPGELRTIAAACNVGEDFWVRSFASPDSPASRLRRLRELRGLTRERLAELIRDLQERRHPREGIRDPAEYLEIVTDIEGGITEPPPEGRLGELLAEALDVSPTVFASSDRVYVEKYAAASDRLVQTERSLREAQDALRQSGVENAHLTREVERLQSQVAMVTGIAKDATAQSRRMEQRESVAVARERVLAATAVCTSLRAEVVHAEEQQKTLDPRPPADDEELSEEEFATRDSLRRRVADLRERLTHAEEALVVAEAELRAQAEEVALLERRDQLAGQREAETMLKLKVGDLRRTLATTGEVAARLRALAEAHPDEVKSMGDFPMNLAEVAELVAHMQSQMDQLEERASRRLAELEHQEHALARDRLTAVPAMGDDERQELAEQLEERATAARRSQRPASPAPASRRGQRRRS